MKNIIPFKKDVIFKTKISEITSISLENSLSINKDVVSGEFIIAGEYKVSDKSTSVEPFNLNLPFEIVMDERYDASRATIDIDDFYYEIVNNNVLSVSIDVLIDKLQEKPLVELEDLVDVTPVRAILDIDDNEETVEEVGSVIDVKNELEEQNNKLIEAVVEEEKEEVRDAIVEVIEENQEKEDVREEVKLESEEEVREEESIMNEKIEEKVEEVREVSEAKEESKLESVRENEKEIVEEKINSLFNQFSSDSEVYVTYNVFILRDGDNIDSIIEKYNTTEEELRKYNDLSNLQIGDKLIIPASYERD